MPRSLNLSSSERGEWYLFLALGRLGTMVLVRMCLLKCKVAPIGLLRLLRSSRYCYLIWIVKTFTFTIIISDHLDCHMEIHQINSFSRSKSPPVYMWVEWWSWASECPILPHRWHCSYNFINSLRCGGLSNTHVHFVSTIFAQLYVVLFIYLFICYSLWDTTEIVVLDINLPPTPTLLAPVLSGNCGARVFWLFFFWSCIACISSVRCPILWPTCVASVVCESEYLKLKAFDILWRFNASLEINFIQPLPSVLIKGETFTFRHNVQASGVVQPSPGASFERHQWPRQPS